MANNSLKEIICFDTETTGIGPKAEILQLSIMDGTEKVLFDEYFCPRRACRWPEAERVHHITPEMVSGLKTIDFHSKRIMDILNSARIYVGYNINFDIRMLENEGFPATPFHREGVQLFDVMRIFAPIYGQKCRNRNTHRMQKLETCAKYYQYDWGEEKAHGALADTRATLHCYKKMNNLK